MAAVARRADRRGPLHALDLALAQRAAANDAQAMAELGVRFAAVEPLCRARNARAGHPLSAEDVADVAQEVRARAWERLLTFAGQATLETWLFTFVELLMRNATRKVRRRARRHAGPVADVVEFAAPTEASVFHDDVYGCLEAQAALDHQILRLKFFDGMTLDAIARRLALNLNTLKARYVRALHNMRECLSANGDEERPCTT